MSKSQAPYLYKETRLNLDSGTTIGITLPSNGVTSFLSRNQPRRTVVKHDYADISDTDFTRRCVGSEGSLFFRSIGKYPRCFLWRVLDERKSLDVRAVDIERQRGRDGQDAALTIVLGFPSPIKPFGIAFAEPADRDAISIFVLTNSHELYTLTLSRDFFVRSQASEVDVTEWCQISTPTSFGFRYPYRIVASNAMELWISLHDGGLLQLQRKPGDDGAAWRETFFADSGWSASIRGLIPWKGQSTVRFGDVELNASTSAGLAVSPDEKFLYTVQLNHTLRAWNLISGKQVLERDLLNEDLKNLQKTGQYFLGASQPQLIQIVTRPRHEEDQPYHVITFSPKQHRFKIWAVNNPEQVEMGLEDLGSEVDLSPPVDELMNTTVWNLEEFHLDASYGWSDAHIWIRARSGPNSQVFTLRFDLHGTRSELEKAWRTGWTAVDSGSLTVEALKHVPDQPRSAEIKDADLHLHDSNARWLQFFFAPDRFTSSTLEAALSMLRTGLKQTAPQKKATSDKRPLKDRLVDAIASSITIRERGDVVAADSREVQLSARWQAFYGLVRDLHKRRGDHLALAFDRSTNSPWMALADYVAPIRTSSEFELLSDNDDFFEEQDDGRLPGPLADSLQSDQSARIAKLLAAARHFRRNLSPEFHTRLSNAVDRDILEDHWVAVPARLDAFDANCELDSFITEGNLRHLIQALVHSVDHRRLTNSFWRETFQRFGERQHGVLLKTKDITSSGVSTLVQTARETLELQTEILLDILLLTVVVAVYPDFPDMSFDVNSVFVSALDQLRQHRFLLWLLQHAVSLPAQPSQSTSSTLSSSKSGAPAMITRSLQEILYGNDIFNVKLPDLPLAKKITYWSRVWILGAVRNDPALDDIPGDVMGMLVSAKQWQVAQHFRKFLKPSPWSAYLEGRLHLEQGEFTLAARQFRAASFGLSLTSKRTFDHYEIVPLDERGLFGNGVSAYYQHILGLFEKAKSYSYVAEFAKLALQHLSGADADDQSEDVRTDVLSRLFTASVETSRFEDAYSAVSRSTNAKLRAAHLTSLVTHMVARKQSSLLLTFPFATFSDDVDAILEKESRKILNLDSAPPYHKVLYAYRTSRNDFRGAASTLYECLQRLKSSAIFNDGAIVQYYLMIISTLSAVHPNQAWIFSESQPTPADDSNVFGNGPRLGQGKPLPKRRMVTLEEIRKEYQAELDRQSDVEHGRFPFVTNGEAMDFS